MATGYLMQAINLYDILPIKTIRALLSGKIVDSSPQELVVQYRDDAYAFVFRFGCIVFFNVSNLEIEAETQKIHAALGKGLDKPTTESYQVNIGATAMRVEFEYVDLKKFSLDQLWLIATTVGQSAALEYFELAAEKKARGQLLVHGRSREIRTRSDAIENALENHWKHGSRPTTYLQQYVDFGSAEGNVEKSGVEETLSGATKQLRHRGPLPDARPQAHADSR